MPKDVKPCETCPDDADEFAAGTVTADNEAEADAAPDPRGNKIQRWRGLLAPYGKPTGDGRRFAAGALTHRDLPAPLRWQRSDEGGHKAAVVIGTLDKVDPREDGVYGEGTMFTPDPEQLPKLAEDVREAKFLLDQKVIGPSVDLDAMEFHALPSEEGDFADGAQQKRPEIEVDKGRISAATLVPIPAFAEARPFELYEVDADEFAAEQAASMFAHVQVDGWDALPVADAAYAWDAPGAVERLTEFAAGDPETFRSAFLWHDPGRPDDPAGCRFPLLDVIDGEPTLVPAAITAAGERLAAAQLPETDKEVMRAVLASIEGGEDDSLVSLFTAGFEVDPDLAALAKLDGETFAAVADLAEEVALARDEGEEVVDAATFASRFDKLKAKLAGHVADPAAVAAKIGRRKYGKAGMERLAKGAPASKVKPLAASAYLEALTAAAATPVPTTVRPPAAWFNVPEADQRTPLTITPEGQVFGHVADWRTCHTGFAGQCVRAPKSKTNYAYFHTGATLTADGSEVAVGRLSVGGGHADTSLGFRAATAHYDDASTAVAEVRAIDGRHGIWVSGQVLPKYRGTDMEDALRRHPPSGDWRPVGGNLEMVHVLSVNSPGFPIPRVAMAASAATGAGAELVPTALVAAGIVATPEQEALAASAGTDAAPAPDVDSIVRRAVAEFRAQEQAAARMARAGTIFEEMDEAAEHLEILALRERALAAAALID